MAIKLHFLKVATKGWSSSRQTISLPSTMFFAMLSPWHELECNTFNIKRGCLKIELGCISILHWRKRKLFDSSFFSVSAFSRFPLVSVTYWSKRRKWSSHPCAAFDTRETTVHSSVPITRLKCCSILVSPIFLILSSALRHMSNDDCHPGLCIYTRCEEWNSSVTVLSSSAPLQLELELQSLDLFFLGEEGGAVASSITTG